MTRTASPRAPWPILSDTFSSKVTAEDTGRTKPDPAPYLAAADRLGLDPAACVAVEDTPTGVASARAAGCSVLAVPSTVSIAKADRITLLDSLERADLALLSTLTVRTSPTADVEPHPRLPAARLAGGFCRRADPARSAGFGRTERTGPCPGSRSAVGAAGEDVGRKVPAKARGHTRHRR
ncbi:HAD family hydrolase [Streptomyces sp. NPDC058357]|uniref:HAD family hydrolase n=1 Tax=Streptomyces sp. NPDC058357 TaxID=3346456 RepID=UPI0036515460